MARPTHRAPFLPVSTSRVSSTSTQLDELERRRDGADLALHLRFRGVLLPAQSPDQPPAIPTAFWTDAEFRIKKAEWVELLEQWDYAQGFLLQVPRFRRPSSPAAERAA